MAIYVLVHGAWHGGWCWRKVVPLLRTAGHDVYAPTLTGLGERAHLASPEVTLDTRIQDIVNVLYYEDLHDVILVGHAFAGMVITGVADRVPERLAHLVYLDAWVPHDGETPADIMRLGAPVPLPFPPGSNPPPIGAFGVADPADVAWAEPRLTPMVAGGPSPLLLSNPDAMTHLPRTYIRCIEFQFQGQDVCEQRVRSEPGWRYRELAANHDAMITHPPETADLLLEVVPQASRRPTSTAR